MESKRRTQIFRPVEVKCFFIIFGSCVAIEILENEPLSANFSLFIDS
jgi:hypothetical protein